MKRRGLSLRSRRRRPGRRQHGMAMLAVITAVAICMVIVNEFSTRTTIDVMQSRNNLDQMRGHFLARSSLNLTELVLRLQRVVDTKGEQWGVPPGTQLTMFADTLMMAFGGDHTMVEDAIGISADQVKGLGAGIGTFGVEITPVDGKINVNCAANGGRFAELTATLIQSLIYPAAFDLLFEEEDAEGWRRDRKTQVTAIIDYIDSDAVKSEIRDNKLERTSAPEDYNYEQLRDPYKAKNNRLDSVSELRLVRGVDDRFWTLFGKAFRAYGTCKINLRGLDDAKVIAAVIALAAKDENDVVLRNPAALWAISNLVLLGKDYGYYYTTPQEFIDFVKNPREALMDLGTGGAGGTGGAAPPPSNMPLPGGIELPAGIEGIELDSGKLGDITESKALINYEVKAWGEVQRAPLVSSRRTIRAFWNQEHINQQMRTTVAKEGTWFYLREE
jgi:general secretion pathway protein K